MSAIDIIISIGINILPIFLMVIPYFFLRKRVIGKIYFRFLMGITVFFLIYWVLPIMFQVGIPPKQLIIAPQDEGNILLGVSYILAKTGALISQFLTYPLVTLPFIFIIAPIISFFIIWFRLRKQDGGFKVNLDQMSYTYQTKPVQIIRDSLLKKDWKREKEIFKLMIVLLPISLYLLQVVFEILVIENVSLTSGETTLGWFLEIIFVYIATFVFSFELLLSSKIALKGRFFGEEVRNQAYKSLYSVGAPISILAGILFIVKYLSQPDLLFVIFYFFGYFLMATFIFVLFLKIFEPISIIIFIKLLDWWKNRDKAKVKLDSTSIGLNIFYSLIAIGVYLGIYYVISIFIFEPYLSDIQIQNASNYAYPTPSLYGSIGFELLILLGFVNVLVSLVIFVLFLSNSLKFIKKKPITFIIYLPVIIIMSLFLAGTTEYWITGQVSTTQIFGFEFFTLRSASFSADLHGILSILSTPYTSTRYIFNILLWSLFLYYIRKDFKSKNVSVDTRHLEKILFSDMSNFLSYDDYNEVKQNYLIYRKEDITDYEINKDREEVKNILILLETEKLLSEIIPTDEKEKHRFYFTLKYLFNNGHIKIYQTEFSYTFEKVEKQGLYIIYDDGRGIFDYAFLDKYDQDPNLIAGMFSAITSFIKETTKSQDLLKTIDHGDITILIEYGTRIFGALFIKGKQSTDIREKLKLFITQFESKYTQVLEDWSGALIHFKDDHKLVEEIFKEG